MNDASGRDVQIDYIVVDGVTVQSEDQVTNTGVWQDESCGGSYSEWLHCGGYIDYGAFEAPEVTTIQENTQGFCSVDGAIESNNSGYTGSGFANTDNTIGSGINWSVSFNSLENYNFTWRYANGGGTDRSARLLVNGSVIASSVSFPQTAEWTSWNTVTVNVSLPAGISDIRLEATQASGLANIDFMEITGAASAVNCSNDLSSELIANYNNPDSKIVNKESFETHELLLYPNPSDNVLNISWQGSIKQGDKLEIFDANGQIKIEQEVIDNYFTIDVSDYPSGIYIVSFTTENGTVSKKFIK
ncbi:T9SS type A sorting domain-containing protein [Fulvivirga maritima]|nr:T9SS type A sorting domain-containing protein [Fulvivirga maritima]